MAFKDDFKKGCEAAGVILSKTPPDDSFSCNIRTGGTIRCVGTSCTYSPKFKGNTGVVVSQTKPGIGELLTLSSGSGTGIIVDLTTAGVEEILAVRSRKV
jgi:hypothetical protein